MTEPFRGRPPGRNGGGSRRKQRRGRHLCPGRYRAGGDAICLTAIGQRYADQDHAEAARSLGKVDREAGKRLASLVRLKPPHYGSGFASDEDRTRALRAAEALVEDAVSRTTGG